MSRALATKEVTKEFGVIHISNAAQTLSRSKNSSSKRSSIRLCVINSSLPSSCGQGMAAEHFRRLMKHRGRTEPPADRGFRVCEQARAYFQRLERVLADVHLLPRYLRPGHET